MSDTQEQPKKLHHRSPEWMAEMRLKAQAKKAELKRIRDAEKLKSRQEHEEKLKNADAVFKQKKPVAVSDEIQPSTPTDEPDVVGQQPINATNNKSKQKRITDEDYYDYKQAYYKEKLELLRHQRSSASTPIPHTAMPTTAVAYDIAKHNVKQHFNKQVMSNLWKTYFGNDDCPY